MKTENKLKYSIPSWVATLYIIFSLIIVPWTIYIAITLPTHHLSAHWDVSWVGLDIGITISLFLTGILAGLKSRWVVIAAATTGSFLIIDAWFDIISSRTGLQLDEAIILAVFIELPLAILSYLLAARALTSHTA